MIMHEAQQALWRIPALRKFELFSPLTLVHPNSAGSVVSHLIA